MTGKKRGLATLFAIVFTDLVGFGIVIPLLPLFAQSYHPAPWVFGLLMASFSAMQFVFSPLLGRLSDRFGRRPVLIISLIGSVAGYLIFAFAHSLVVLFASRIVAGIAGANISTAQAVIADLTTPEKRARGMGLIGAAFGLGFIAGPAIGGFLVQFGQPGPGLGAATCSTLALVMTIFLLPESRPAGSNRSFPDTQWKALRGVVSGRWAMLNPLLLVTFALVTGFSAFEVTFAQFLNARLGMAVEHVWWVFVYIGMLAAVVQGGIVGRLNRRFGERRLLMAGIAFTALALTGLAATFQLSVMVAILPILALGQGLIMPSLSSLISKSADANSQGLVLGAYQGIAALARVAGPFAGEEAFGHLGTSSAPLIAAGLTLIGFAVMALAVLPTRSLQAAPVPAPDQEP